MSEPIITFPILGDKFRLDFPSYFTVFGWKIHLYGILIAIGFVLAVLYAMKRAKEFGLTEDSIIDLLLSG
ncbi:MAG: prolipoprotein diacylglyceryl transferase, partial [Oscillospiraceae bacterium]|nr:prolipoprotein diacylglyceryl transferase [Oscillospiraceae bacterium]